MSLLARLARVCRRHRFVLFGGEACIFTALAAVSYFLNGTYISALSGLYWDLAGNPERMAPGTVAAVAREGLSSALTLLYCILLVLPFIAYIAIRVGSPFQAHGQGPEGNTPPCSAPSRGIPGKKPITGLKMRSLRKSTKAIMLAISVVSTAVAVIVFFWIVITLLLGAIPSLSWYFITTPESATPRIGMGIANAIVGTLVISLIATALAIPLAIGTAVYLTRYAREGRLVSILRFFIEVLSGTPSVVLGMFGFLVFVYYLKFFTGGYSLISGSLALGILTMPVIERSIEDAIFRVPAETEAGSYALGATKWQTIRNITIPVAMSGIITGIILGFGRAAEESAVVILTAGYSQFLPEIGVKANPNLFLGIKVYPFQDLIATLPYSVYHAYENSNVIPLSNGFAAAFVLICIVLVINTIARLILWRASR
jgi:phosphate transport system permease protein